MAKVEILAFATGLPRTEVGSARVGTAAAAKDIAQQLFPGRIGAGLPPADLLTASYPVYGQIYASTFGGTTLICGQDLIELADLAAAVSGITDGRNAYRLQINDAVDSMALEIVAPDGNSVREVMLIAEEGVIFDIGPRLDFERPFWSGARDQNGVYAALNGSEMPFDAIEFGEAALRMLFGFVIDNDPLPDDLDARRIQLHGFVIAADPADPSDMSRVRSGQPTPPLTEGDVVGAGRAAAAGVAPEPETDPEAADSTESWWQRFKRKMLG